MSLPVQYHNAHLPIKYFLTSYRALSDGRSGIRILEKQVDTENSLLFE